MPSRRHGTATPPIANIEAAFRRIQLERMAGLPILNPALRVEAVGVAQWQDHWLLVLITPWCMNLMLLPHGTAEWREGSSQQRVFRRFPSGDFAFLGGDEPEIGAYQSCALYSPMSDFPDQASARATALAALQALFLAPADTGVAQEKSARERSAQGGATSMSRRGFLSAGFGASQPRQA